MTGIVVVGVGARHANGGSDGPRQVEDAAALAAASLAVVIYHIYIKCYLRFIPTIPIPVSQLSPLFLIPILFL